MGAAAKVIFERGHETNGKLYPLVSQFIKTKDVAADFEKGLYLLIILLTVVTGKKARFDLVPHEAFIGAISPYMGELVAIDLWEMFQAFADIGFGSAGEPENLKNTEDVLPLPRPVINLKLGVHLNTWVDFLNASGWQGPQ
jgi:hypothetical protein